MARENRGEAAERKPVIALAASVNRDERAENALSRYISAIRSAGGEPRVLPDTADEQVLRGEMNQVDGLLVTGGDDVPPEMYGSKEDPEQELKKESPIRLSRDIACLKHAREAGMPVLGICYGMQLLNVVEGGTLYQDIGKEALPYHRPSRTGERYVEHEVEIEPGTFLYKILGARHVTVRSSHHEAVKKVGPGLVVSAVCHQGDIIEAIEKKGPFFLAVQWHPETHDRQPDPVSVEFLNAASVWARRRRT